MSVAEHLSEDEQLENLKKWWRDYGIITIAIIGIVTIQSIPTVIILFRVMSAYWRSIVGRMN